MRVVIDRYYDPATGQFLSVDPMVATTGEAYAYTGDDPVNDTDPSGLADCGWNPICYVGSGIDKTNNALNAGVNWASGQVNSAVCGFTSSGKGVLTGWTDRIAGCSATTTSSSPATTGQGVTIAGALKSGATEQEAREAAEKQLHINIPDDWAARKANTDGWIFQPPNTPPGSNGNAIRVMGPSRDNRYGEVRVTNKAGRYVDAQGNPGGRQDSATHRPFPPDDGLPGSGE
jgi:hypothetical protein